MNFYTIMGKVKSMAPKLQAQFDAVKVLNDTQSKFEMVQILDEKW